jgi:hypothetical protein
LKVSASLSTRSYTTPLAWSIAGITNQEQWQKTYSAVIAGVMKCSGRRVCESRDETRRLFAYREATAKRIINKRSVKITYGGQV